MTRPLLVPSFSSLLQGFFCQRLIAQRHASTQTVASYRDAFRLLLRYAEERTRKPPVALTLEDLDAPLILGFLNHLEVQRGNSPRSRNARLAAIRSFLRFAAFEAPASLPAIQRVLAIPMKRFDRRLLGFLTRDEVAAILAAPDLSTWSGHRDHVLLTTLYNTGARVSEIIALRVEGVALDRSPFIRLHGKGRKERAVPLWRSTASALTRWLRRTALPPEAPLFPNRRGTQLSRSGVEHRLRAAIGVAQSRCPSLQRRRISPHSFRHTTAMHLLQSGVDVAVIAMWLGHESPATTHLYVEADLAMKHRALDKLQPPKSRGAASAPTIAFSPSSTASDYAESHRPDFASDQQSTPHNRDLCIKAFHLAAGRRVARAGVQQRHPEPLAREAQRVAAVGRAIVEVERVGRAVTA